MTQTFPHESFPMEPVATGLVWVFGWAAFFLIWYHLRTKRRQQIIDIVHRERTLAMEKGTALPPYPESLDGARKSMFASLNPRWPLGVGAFSIMTGLGAALSMKHSGDPYHQMVWPFGFMGVFIGLGLFLHYALTRPRT